jgi:hypothetical protein
MPGPPPEHAHLRLLKGNPGKRPARSPPRFSKSSGIVMMADIATRYAEPSATVA